MARKDMVYTGLMQSREFRDVHEIKSRWTQQFRRYRSPILLNEGQEMHTLLSLRANSGTTLGVIIRGSNLEACRKTTVCGCSSWCKTQRWKAGTYIAWLTVCLACTSPRVPSPAPHQQGEMVHWRWRQESSSATQVQTSLGHTRHCL